MHGPVATVHLRRPIGQHRFQIGAFRDSEGGSLAVWIEIEINGPIKVDGPAADGEVPHEGDVLIF